MTSLEKRLKYNKTTKNMECVLNRCFVQEMNVIQYVSEESSSEIDFIERSRLIIDDLQELLCMPYEQFWCQVIFEPTILKCLDSYLQKAPRWYDFNATLLSEDSKNLHNDLHRLIFMVMLRLSANKESDENFVSRDVHGDLIYQNFIFDVSKLMDICILYGEDNLPLVTKMIKNIFKNQPLYKEDFKSALGTVKKLFGQLCDQCKKIPSSIDSPVKLNSSLGNNSMSEESLMDLINYLVDISLTLAAFISICDKLIVDTLLDEKFDICVASLYENCLPHIQERLRGIVLSTSNYERVCISLSRISESLTKIVKHTVLNHFLDALLESESAESKSQLVDEFIHSMSILSSYKEFVGALQVNYSLEDEIRLILETADLPHHVDSEALIHRWLSTLNDLEVSNPNHPFVVLNRQQQRANSPGSGLANNHTVNGHASAVSGDLRGSYSDLMGACAARPATPPLDKVHSMILSVADVIPDLGEGFIQACLEEYDYNFESVINALLEGSLPPYLNKLDRKMPLKNRNAETSRWNDLANDLVHFSIHKGKKDEIDSSSGISEEIKAKIMSSTDAECPDDVIPDEILNAGLYNLEYEDEYDDTYDSTVAAVEPDTWIDRRENNNNMNRDHFIENPEVIRERQARRRAERGNANHSHPNRDVVGNRRGAGQNGDVRRNRTFKDRNKDSRANHNRKFLSDRKHRGF